MNWPKKTYNRNRLHCQFNRNRRLLTRLNLEIFTQHHCAMNRGFGGWVSSFTIVYFGYVSVEASGVVSSQIVGGQKIWEVKMFDCRRATLFCLGHRFSKHKMTRYAACPPWLPLCWKLFAHQHALNPGGPAASITFAANSRFVPGSLPVSSQK